MANLRKGKGVVQVIVKEKIIKLLDKIAEQEATSRSAIAGKIIEENIDKYKKEPGQ